MKTKEDALWNYIFELYGVKSYEELKKVLKIKIPNRKVDYTFYQRFSDKNREIESGK
ncbi:MAG: hypothetical protein QME40_01575 [bacterium]|nr:hypothetical protein [bacterium]